LTTEKYGKLNVPVIENPMQKYEDGCGFVEKLCPKSKTKRVIFLQTRRRLEGSRKILLDS
jgi:hypothetical protein